MDPNEELKNRVKQLEARLEGVLRYVEDRKAQQLSYPVDDISKINLGMGVAGVDTATAAARSVIVNTNIGQLKVLVAN